MSDDQSQPAPEPDPAAETPRPPRRRRRRPRPLDAAVIGLACRFPGSGDVFGFWRNLLAGRDSTGVVPADRWDASLFEDPGSAAPDRVTTARGGYLADPIGFDPARYGVMPLAVAGGEPEQFLALDAARAALEDAGLGGGPPDGSRVEVVVGRGNSFNRGNLTRFQHGRGLAQVLGVLRALHPEWSEDDFEAVRDDLRRGLPPFEGGTIAGQVTNATAGRVADRFDLGGASFVVDAASASSLVALDLGARSLAEGRADLCLVAGVYLQSDVDFPMVFSRLGALSRRGEARPFAASADGTLPGEGVGAVVLKRLADAERDGDRVYAVVKGVGLASDGRGAGLAAPSARGHARAIRRAYRQSGVDPATVDLVVGHGLGVPASDRAELRALNAVFPALGSGRSRRALGAVGGLIGHAMPAAGMASLISAALSLYHRVVPPTPHADDPHPLLAAGGSFALNRKARPWVHGDDARPRRAGVNAFGFAGANAHAVLQEHTPSADGRPGAAGCMPEWDSEAILIGAPDRRGWVELATALLGWLDHGRNAEIPLKDLAYTLNDGQGPFAVRVGLVVRSTADLRDRLRAAVARLADPSCASVRDAKGTYFWQGPLAGPGRLAFLYPGEGSQYPGMLADLCPHFPEVRAALDAADRVALSRGLRSLPGEQLYGDRDADSPDAGGFWAIDTAVNVVLSSQWAIHQLLTRLGLAPAAVVGHSSGEFLALAAAGVIPDGVELERRMGELGAVFEGLDRDGLVPPATLVAVAAGRERVEAVCREVGPGVVEVAVDNCPHQVVIAGPADLVAEAVARLRSEGVFCEGLPFGRAYHTPRFAAALGPLRRFFDDAPVRPPGAATAVYSCAKAGRVGPGVDEVRRLAVDQWVGPVEFRRTVEAMHADGVRLFVEVGARGHLAGYVEDTLRGRPHFAVAANLPRRSGLTQLNHLVASLYAQGVDLRPGHLYARRRPRRIDLAADYRPPETGPPLAVGFPEMRLSEALAARLRAGPARHQRDPDPSPARNGQYHANGTGDGRIPSEPAGVRHSNRIVAHIDSPGLTDGGEIDEAMLAHLRTMDAFLRTQQEVMAAYLGSAQVEDPSSDPPAAGRGAADVTTEALELVFAVSVPGKAGHDAPDVDDPRGALIGQVARRTGYPPESLTLDLDMEADLGIDSIKRTEILGDLQARGVVPERTDPEALTRCRTLGQVLNLLAPPADRSAAPERASNWVGAVEHLDPGRSFAGVRWIDAADDPVAAHHTLGGRKISDVEPDRIGYPVLPFTVMVELLAQAAAEVLPGRAVRGFRRVRAHRWIAYEATPVALAVRATRDPGRPDEVHVAIVNRGARGAAPAGDDPAVEGVVVLADRRDPAPPAPPFAVPDPVACRFTAGELYRDQWLFHGPALQALERVGETSPGGIEGTLRVLPRRDLLPERLWPVLHTDPIVLDAFTHLLGGWGLDKNAGEEGDVMFPLRLESLDLFGDDPPEGSAVECRIKVLEVVRHRVLIDADLVRPDGRVWVAIRGWEDWRFYWPGRYRDVFRRPESVFVGESLGLTGPPAGLAAVWLEPPVDMGRPVWRDVLEWVQLSPDERLANRARGSAEPALSLRIWGRVAAKEAARRLWREQGLPDVYPADLMVLPDLHGRPRLRSRREPGRDDMPAVSLAHAEGVAVGLAALDPAARIGIDVEAVRPRGPAFEATAFDPEERRWLDRLAAGGADRDEWAARFWTAKEAVGKATGMGLAGGPGSVLVTAANPATGVTTLRLGRSPAAACPDLAARRITSRTARRGDHVWAWAVLDGGHEQGQGGDT